MSDDAVLSCLDRRQTGSTVQLNPCISFLTTRARLAILTALASHQVDEGVIELVQKQQPDDAHLVNVVAWASFAATRRISRWLRPPV